MNSVRVLAGDHEGGRVPGRAVRSRGGWVADPDGAHGLPAWWQAECMGDDRAAALVIIDGQYVGATTG